jgi:uncharacterized protein YbjT (DUF2867 family)
MDIVVHLANLPSFKDNAVLEFFRVAGRNLLEAEINAGVEHHVALSIVGVDIMNNIGYMRAKQAQKELIKESGIPYSIIRSTQFMEFLKGIADQATQGDEVHLSNVLFQPITSADVAWFVTKYAGGAPINGKLDIADPERFEIHEIVSRYLKHPNDPHKVVSNGQPEYFGGEINIVALVPAGKADI